MVDVMLEGGQQHDSELATTVHITVRWLRRRTQTPHKHIPSTSTIPEALPLLPPLGAACHSTHCVSLLCLVTTSTKSATR